MIQLYLQNLEINNEGDIYVELFFRKQNKTKPG